MSSFVMINNAHSTNIIKEFVHAPKLFSHWSKEK